MKRNLLVITIITLWCLNAFAKEPVKGYRGFVELNADIAWVSTPYYVSISGSHNSLRYKNETFCLYGISTSHGFQFNSRWFIGAGVCIQSNTNQIPSNIYLSVPVFLQGRTDWTIGKVPLYADLRIGRTISGSSTRYGQDKVFVSPAIGYYFNWGRRVSANVGIGMSVHGYDRYGDNGLFDYKWLYMPSVKIGIEF